MRLLGGWGGSFKRKQRADPVFKCEVDPAGDCRVRGGGKNDRKQLVGCRMITGPRDPALDGTGAGHVTCEMLIEELAACLDELISPR